MAPSLAFERDHSPYDILFVAAARMRGPKVLSYDHGKGHCRDDIEETQAELAPLLWTLSFFPVATAIKMPPDSGPIRRPAGGADRTLPATVEERGYRKKYADTSEKCP
jgi:hypothetical protein